MSLAAAINDEASYAAGITNLLTLTINGNGSGVAIAGTLTVGNSSIGSNSSHLANITINNNGYIGTAYDSTSLNFTTAGDLVATGKVGIGTPVNTAPGSPLTVSNLDNGTSFSSNRVLQLIGTSTTDGSRVSLAFSGNTNIGNGLAIIEAVNDDQSAGHTSLHMHTYNGSWNTENLVLKGGNVGIGTTSPGDKLTIEGSGAQVLSIYSTDTGSQSTAKTFINLYGENTGGDKRLQGQIASAPGHNASNAGELHFSTNNSSSALARRMTIREDGNVGIGLTVPSQKLDVNGAVRARVGLNLGADTFEGTSSTFTFANGVADQNVDIVLPNASLWGYLEVEVTGFYSNQNALGKLTKRYALGLNVGGTSFSSETRISDAIGPIVDNLHLGPIRWDSGTSTYRIRVAHIVSTGNPFAIKLKAFTTGGKALNLNGVNISSIYTQSTSGLTAHQPHYKTLGIGTADPNYLVHAQNSTATGQSVMATSGNGQFIMAIGSQNSPGVAQEAFVGTLSDTRFKIKVNNVVKGSWTDGGLAIGTHASADYNLHVNSGTTNVVAKFESTDAVAAALFVDSGGNAEIGCNGNDVVLLPAGAEKFRVTQGTSTVGNLVAQGATQVRLVLGSAGNYTNNSSNWIRGNSNLLQFNSAASGFGWEITGAQKMYMDANGTLALSSGQQYSLQIEGNNAGLRFSTGSNQRIYFGTKRAIEGNVTGDTMQISENFATTLFQSSTNTFYGNVNPSSNSTYDLGSPSLRWANVYTGDLHLSNEEKGGNEVDGTTGNWTIQEGDENLYIKNNKTGKKYKFALEEIV